MTLHFTLPGHATKKNSPRAGHRPSAAFEEWEDRAIYVLRHVRAGRLHSEIEGLAQALPLTRSCKLKISVHVKGPEGDAAGYLQAVGDVLDGTRARFAHRKQCRRLKQDLPFVCDYQIVVDDKQFNSGVSARVVRCAPDEQPRVEVTITWQ